MSDCDCFICRTGNPGSTAYRPHSMTPDCWCQDFKDDWPVSALSVQPKRCYMKEQAA